MLLEVLRGTSGSYEPVLHEKQSSTSFFSTKNVTKTTNFYNTANQQVLTQTNWTSFQLINEKYVCYLSYSLDKSPNSWINTAWRCAGCRPSTVPSTRQVEPPVATKRMTPRCPCRPETMATAAETGTLAKTSTFTASMEMQLSESW